MKYNKEKYIDSFNKHNIEQTKELISLVEDKVIKYKTKCKVCGSIEIHTIGKINCCAICGKLKNKNNRQATLINKAKDKFISSKLCNEWDLIDIYVKDKHMYCTVRHKKCGTVKNCRYDNLDHCMTCAKTKKLAWWNNLSKEQKEQHISKCFINRTQNKIPPYQQEIANFIKSLGYKVVQNTRNILNNCELDIYIESAKLAIECNGTYFHSTKKQTNLNYYYNKSKKCEDNGIHLIQIWEHIWQNKTEQAKLKLYLSKCLVNRPSDDLLRQFQYLENNELKRDYYNLHKRINHKAEVFYIDNEYKIIKKISGKKLKNFKYKIYTSGIDITE